MKELLAYTDYVLVVLFLILLGLLLFRILPRTYKTYFRISKEEIPEHVKGLSYFSDMAFWQWLFSKKGRVDLYQDYQQQETLYYNNFTIFNMVWKLALVLLTFRVLVMLFGPTYT